MIEKAMNISKEQFQQQADAVAERMQEVQDVIRRYNDAKKNLSRFIGESDTNYENMLQRIDENVTAAGKAYAALQETKAKLDEDIQNMETLGSEIGETLKDAAEAAASTIQAAIKLDAIL